MEIRLDRRCMSGYCSFTQGRAGERHARWTWPSEAAAAASRSKLGKRLLPIGAKLGRHAPATNGQPIGGAWLCSLASSAAYSAGSASGMVARSCATFIIGPLSPPSAAARAAGLAVAVWIEPKQAGAGDAGRDTADVGADAPVACTRAVRRLRSLSEVIDPKGKAG